MNTETHNGTALSYVLITPAGFQRSDSFPLVILLHGFGASMGDLVGLPSEIDGESYVYALPNAPYRLTPEMGNNSFSWQAGREGVEPLPLAAPSIENLLDTFVAEVSQRVTPPAGKTLLGGFSQGAGLALRYGLARPDIFAGLIALSGAIQDPSRLELPAGRQQRIFLAHGRFDQVVPLERSLVAKRLLEDAGYPLVYQEYDIGHEISYAESRDLGAWVQQVLGGE